MSVELEHFVEVLFKTFDEQSNDPEDFYAFAQRCRDARACFLAGDPLEGEPELQEATLVLYKHAKRTSDIVLRDVDRGLSILSEASIIKARAVAARLAGRIELARLFEANIDNLYEQLPKKFRW